MWPKIAASIRGQYTIGYVSSNASQTGEYRRVRITAKNKHGKVLEVRTRPGYIASTH
jgi:hypothetical protein